MRFTGGTKVWILLELKEEVRLRRSVVVELHEVTERPEHQLAFSTCTKQRRARSTPGVDPGADVDDDAQDLRGAP